MPETKECKLSFIPKYIRQIIDMRPREVVTATRWNELFTLLIEQGDYNTSTIVSIVNEVCELDIATGAQAKSITELYKFIGEMSALQTDEKTNLVEALNEVLNRTIVGTTLQYMTWDTAGVPKAENITPDKIGNDLLICADSATSAKKQFLNTNKELLPRQGNIFPIYFDQGNRVDKITATIYNGVATTQEYPVVTVYGPEIPRMAAKTIVWAGIANGVIQLINPPYPANDNTSPLVTIEIEDRGGQNFWTRPVTTAQKIMDMVNVGKEVRLSFFDAIQGTGDQLYTYENTRQGVCYFRRNVVTEDSVSRISWGVQYDGSIVASETPYRGGVLTISTINGVGDPKPKEITTVNLIKYATVGTQTPWYDTEIPAADIAKMSVGQNVRLLVHDKDRNKDLYLLGVVRAVNGNKNCSIEGAGADDGFPLFIDDASARANGTWSSQKIAGSICNPNLLDNWYFLNPVNQRGKEIYNHGNYGIDRWKCASGMHHDVREIVTADGITLENKRSDYAYWKQPMEFPILKESVSHTISILTPSGELFSSNEEFSPIPGVLVYQADDSSLDFRIDAGVSFSMVAIKYELGSTQTLAHRENGKWVLNEIPDYGEQLRRCQRYQWSPFSGAAFQVTLGNAIGISASKAAMLVTCPASMRAVPALVKTTDAFWTVGANGAQKATMKVSGMGANGITVTLDGTFVKGDSYTVYADSPVSGSLFMFDSNL